MCNALNVLPVRICQINTVHWFAEKILQNVNNFLQLEIIQRLSSLQKKLTNFIATSDTKIKYIPYISGAVFRFTLFFNLTFRERY